MFNVADCVCNIQNAWSLPVSLVHLQSIIIHVYTGVDRVLLLICCRLALVYPFGYTLQVQRPAFPLISSRAISLPANKPLAAAVRVRGRVYRFTTRTERGCSKHCQLLTCLC